MLVSLFALSVATAQPSAAVAAPAVDATAVVGMSVVFLDCEVGPTALSDCKVLNGDVVDEKTAATALKLASNMTVPPALAQAHPGRITVKLNVTP
ncbi:MAG TPA: hypothetical protein VG939_04815 [Caulobacteraceae bacterium]|nr:hypothetical protein [Caulobacteraceae bacterium]